MDPSPQPGALKEMVIGARQKSKHQITWLAMHAVQNERSLRERQQRGMLTKKETQGKYGF